MDAVDAVDRRLRILAVAEGRHRNKPCSPAQPPVHVAAEVRMVEHALQRMRMQHLQQQAADPADHHRHDIGMDHPDRRVPGEQCLVRRRDRLLPTLDVVEYAAHLLDELEAQAFGQGDRRHRRDYAAACEGSRVVLGPGCNFVACSYLSIPLPRHTR